MGLNPKPAGICHGHHLRAQMCAFGGYWLRHAERNPRTGSRGRSHLRRRSFDYCAVGMALGWADTSHGDQSCLGKSFLDHRVVEVALGCAGICHRDQSHSCKGFLGDEIAAVAPGCGGTCHSAHRRSHMDCLGREEVGEIQENHGPSLRPSLRHHRRQYLRPNLRHRSHLEMDRLRTHSHWLELYGHRRQQ